jgi:pimeloyl-ACP methyl ester carboxylesterase
MPSAAGLYYFAHGADDFTRPPVILIHGAGGHHLYWPPQVRRLHGQRILAVDLPGHGKSEGLGHHSIDDYAAEVAEFVKALRLNRVIVVGHSMGGAVALKLALKFPKRVIGLGVVGSAARLRVNPALLRTAADPSKAAEAFRMVNDLSFAPVTPVRLKELAGQRMADTRASILYGDLLACDEFDSTAQAGKIVVPTLIICGAADKMISLGAAEALQQQINGARLEVIRDAGHMVMLEKPDRVAELLEEFIDSIPYQPGR